MSRGFASLEARLEAKMAPAPLQSRAESAASSASSLSCSSVTTSVGIAQYLGQENGGGVWVEGARGGGSGGSGGGGAGPGRARATTRGGPALWRVQARMAQRNSQRHLTAPTPTHVEVEATGDAERAHTDTMREGAVGQEGGADATRGCCHVPCLPVVTATEQLRMGCERPLLPPTLLLPAPVLFGQH